MCRFSIRESLLVTLIVALQLGWWIDRSRQVERYDRLHYAVRNARGEGIPFDNHGEVIVSRYYPDPEPAPDLVVDFAQYKMKLGGGPNQGGHDYLILPPKVRGTITAIRDSDLVEVSLGLDDGLHQNHQLDVFRGSSYLGRVRVVKTTCDNSVAQIINEIQPEPIKKGDRVTTIFLQTDPPPKTGGS